jgi:carbonic anhydrase/acetyltransferase-like protein (isoleucine patch superfamily)
MNRKIEVVEDDAGKATRYRRHPNGGGLVGPGADVDESSFVGAMTYVEAGARVGSGCRIGRRSWIDRQAVIGDLVFIGDDVYVGRGTTLGNRTHIGSHSRIGAGALIGRGIRLLGDTTVPEGARIAAAKPARHAAVNARHAQGAHSRMAA